MSIEMNNVDKEWLVLSTDTITSLEKPGTKIYEVDTCLHKIYSNGAWRLYFLPTASAADETAPVAGASGAITTADVADTTLTLNWTKATDDVSSQESLVYYVYQSAANNIDTVSNAETNGTLLNSGGTEDIATYDVTGLTAETTYYFNVVVEDESGNKGIYVTKSQATTA